MTVEVALVTYLDTARMLVRHGHRSTWGMCRVQEYLGLCAEADSLALDVAAAAARAPSAAPSWLGDAS